MRLERMSWKDCEEYFKDHDMVILTTGSTENHGIHNPLGTDTMIPNKILELVEKQSDVLIAPTLPYGDADFHTEYTGTILKHKNTTSFTNLFPTVLFQANTLLVSVNEPMHEESTIQHDRQIEVMINLPFFIMF